MDYAGNSHKAKEAAKAEEEKPEKNLEKVISGEVIVKKQSRASKLSSIFFEGSFKDAVAYTFYEKMIPGIRDVIFDMGRDGWHRMLYGSNASRPRDPRGGPKVNYMGMSRGPAPRRIGGHHDQQRTQQMNMPRQPPHPYVQNRTEANNIILASREDAQQTLDTMMECVSQYEVVSLADLYELVGLPQATIDQKWGWTYLTSARIEQVREGFLLVLPPMEEI